MPRGNLNRKDLENIIIRRLRKISTEEPNKQKKQKLSKLRKNFFRTEKPFYVRRTKWIGKGERKNKRFYKLFKYLDSKKFKQ